MKFIGGVFKIALGIIGAIIIIAVIIAVAAGGSSSSPTATTTAPPDATSTATTPAAPAAPTAASGTVSNSFSGNGTKAVGNIVVPADSTIRWTNDGGEFSAISSDFNISISSQAASGASDLPAGTYKGVQILAVGNWTFKVVTK